MLNRYSFNFDNQVWKNNRIGIRKLPSGSIWHRFLAAILKVFPNTLYPIINYIYDQIFLEHCDYDSLKKKGRGYKIYPIAGEGVEDFRNRIRLRISLLSTPPSTALIKSIFSIYCDCEAEIIKTKNMSNVFTIGVTPIGVGKIVDSNYLRFTFKIMLPDLSASDIDREYIKGLIDEFDPINEAFIYEQRPAGLYQW